MTTTAPTTSPTRSTREASTKTSGTSSCGEFLIQPPLVAARRYRGLLGLARMPAVLNRCYDRMRHRSAQSVGNDQRTVQSFEHLRGHKSCLLATYRRSGQSVPKRVRFGLESSFAASGRSEGPAHPQRPAHRHRCIDWPAEEERAEAALQASYGTGRGSTWSPAARSDSRRTEGAKFALFPRGELLALSARSAYRPGVGRADTARRRPGRERGRAHAGEAIRVR